MLLNYNVIMCLATPIQIKEIKEGFATVSHDGKDFKVSLQLVPMAKVGDWLLAHGEIAISILPEREALDILDLIKQAETTH
jgi:hydrogenase expression/formation protein HypC